MGSGQGVFRTRQVIVYWAGWRIRTKVRLDVVEVGNCGAPTGPLAFPCSSVTTSSAGTVIVACASYFGFYSIASACWIYTRWYSPTWFFMLNGHSWLCITICAVAARWNWWYWVVMITPRKLLNLRIRLSYRSWFRIYILENYLSRIFI